MWIEYALIDAYFPAWTRQKNGRVRLILSPIGNPLRFDVQWFSLRRSVEMLALKGVHSNQYKYIRSRNSIHKNRKIENRLNAHRQWSMIASSQWCEWTPLILSYWFHPIVLLFHWSILNFVRFVPHSMCGSIWTAFISEQWWFVTKTNYIKMNRNERISWMVSIHVCNEFGRMPASLASALERQQWRWCFCFATCDRDENNPNKINHRPILSFLSSIAEINCTHPKCCRRNENWKIRRCVIKALECINESSK